MEPVRGSHADWAFYVQEVTRRRGREGAHAVWGAGEPTASSRNLVAPMQLPDPPSEEAQIVTVSSAEPEVGG